VGARAQQQLALSVRGTRRQLSPMHLLAQEIGFAGAKNAGVTFPKSMLAKIWSPKDDSVMGAREAPARLPPLLGCIHTTLEHGQPCCLCAAQGPGTTPFGQSIG